MSLFFALSAFHFVQDFVSLVDPRSNLLFTSKTRSVVEIADDASILEMQLRREIELNCHTAKTSRVAPRFQRVNRHPRFRDDVVHALLCLGLADAGLRSD